MRVSTKNQKHDSQQQIQKERYPNAVVIKEIISGARNSKPKLDNLVAGLDRGDELIVYSLDRLGRSLQAALATIEQIQAKGAKLISVRENVNFASPTGRLVQNVMLSVSAMEKDLVRERVLAGLAAARAKGRTGGRKPTKSNQILLGIKLVLEDGRTILDAANSVGLSRGYLSKHVNLERRRQAAIK